MSLSDETIGQRLGEIIMALVDLIADVDKITRDDVLEILFAEWWVNKIGETGDR